MQIHTTYTGRCECNHTAQLQHCEEACALASKDAFNVHLSFVGERQSESSTEITFTLSAVDDRGVPLREGTAAASTAIAVEPTAVEVDATISVAGLEDGAYQLAISSSNATFGFPFESTTAMVVLRAAKNVGYIVTDKPIYKPGQTVQARVFALTAALMAAHASVVVELTDPASNKIKKWDLEVDAGFATFELPLSAKPVLGVWTLSASTPDGFADVVAASFEVEEYVLPKFEVVLDVPPTLSTSEAARGVSGTVHGLYTYGEKVVGSVRLELWKQYDLQPQPVWMMDVPPGPSPPTAKPVATLDIKLAGGTLPTPFEFELVDRPATPAPDEPGNPQPQLPTFMIMDCFRCTPKGWMSFGETLVVMAVVTEIGTEEVQEAEATITTAALPFNHRFEMERDSFVPGLPFAGSLTTTKLDGKPAITHLNSDDLIVANVTVSFCNTWSSTSYESTKGMCENDDRTVTCILEGGKCDFEVVVPFHAERVHFHVEEPLGNYPQPNKQSTYSKAGAESKSKSFLRVKPSLVAADGSSALVLELSAAATTAFSALHWHAVTAGRLAASGVASGWTPECVDAPPIPEACKCRTDREAQQCREGDSNSKCSVNKKTCQDAQSVWQRYDSISKTSVYDLQSGIPCGRYSGQACAAEAEIELPVELSAELMAGEAAGSTRFLVYFVNHEGEVVPDEHELDIARALRTTLAVTVGSPVASTGSSSSPVDYFLPGGEVTLTIETSSTKGAPTMENATSLVGLAAIDASVLLLRDQKSLSADAVLADQAAMSAGPTAQWYSRYADDVIRHAGLVFLSSDGIFAPKDNGVVFGDDGGPIVMIAVNDVFDGGEGVFTKDASGGSTTAEPVRAYFPETWLYDSVTVSDGSPETLTLAAPDTITSWILSGVAVSSGTGLGISAASTVKVFKPFFLEMKLPYSIVRGETFELVVGVYNYGGNDEVDAGEAAMDVAVALDEPLEGDAAYVIMDASVKQCTNVSSTQPCSLSFFIKPTVVGPLMLGVAARSATQADAAVRSVLVKPDGIEHSYTDNKFVELEETQSEARVNLTTGIPENASLVPGATSIQFVATADLMGASIDGLDRLVRLPTGCGEQNMITFAPIISIRKYLASIDGLTAKLEIDTDKYMLAGYQRELTYRRSDNGFSAFGNSDPESSMWLSAFVLRSFAQANGFVYVDPVVLVTTASWIVGLQDETAGTFPTYGRVIHTDMKGGAAGSALTLTSYVTLALLECMEAVDALAEDVRATLEEDYGAAITSIEGGLESALFYIESNFNNSNVSVYGTALTAFVLTKAGSEVAEHAREAMMGMSSTSDSGTFWNTSPLTTNVAVDVDDNAARLMPPPWERPVQRSSDVEATGYALLAMVAAGRVADGLHAAKWLTASRRGNGGWQSTQDTIIALEALSEYAAAAMAQQGDLSVLVVANYRTGGTDVGGPFSAVIQLTAQNFGVLQTVDVPVSPTGDPPESLSVVASGSSSGKCLVSATVTWFEAAAVEGGTEPPIVLSTSITLRDAAVRRNRWARKDNEAPEDAAEADVDAQDTGTSDAPVRYDATVCASMSDAESEAGMSVIEVDFYSGYALDGTAASVQEANDQVKLVENSGTGLAFYLDNMTSTPTCVSYTAVRIHKVASVAPMKVKAYDYYELESATEVMVNADPDLNEDVAESVAEALRASGQCSRTCGGVRRGNRAFRPVARRARMQSP